MYCALFLPASLRHARPGLMCLLQCYNISTTEPLTAEEAETLAWLLRETFEPELLTASTEFPSVGANDAIVEVRESTTSLLNPSCCSIGHACCCMHAVARTLAVA